MPTPRIPPRGPADPTTSTAAVPDVIESAMQERGMRDTLRPGPEETGDPGSTDR